MPEPRRRGRLVDQQVYAALRSVDYRSILKKIAVHGPLAMTFKKSEVVGTLTDAEKGKFNNFLQKMKQLNVLRSGANAGEYVFNVRMVRVYIGLIQGVPTTSQSESPFGVASATNAFAVFDTPFVRHFLNAALFARLR